MNLEEEARIMREMFHQHRRHLSGVCDGCKFLQSNIKPCGNCARMFDDLYEKG